MAKKDLKPKFKWEEGDVTIVKPKKKIAQKTRP